jgi:hypothetical protein
MSGDARITPALDGAQAGHQMFTFYPRPVNYWFASKYPKPDKL